MLTKIKLAFVGLLAFASAVFYALLQKEKKERAEDAVNAEQAARTVERRSGEALSEGLQNEAKIKDENPGSIVDHFSK